MAGTLDVTVGAGVAGVTDTLIVDDTAMFTWLAAVMPVPALRPYKALSPRAVISRSIMMVENYTKSDGAVKSQLRT